MSAGTVAAPSSAEQPTYNAADVAHRPADVLQRERYRGNHADALRMARSSPAGLARVASDGRWIPAQHLQLVNRKLLEVASGQVTRLIITMPPQHGKSELCSQYFPAWYLGCFPDRRVILASYNSEYALEWGRKARDVLEEWGAETFGVSVRQDSKAANKWDVRRYMGGMKTAGSEAGITGRTAHLAIVDDPFKDDKEANSEARREGVWTWYQSVLATRLRPNAAIVIIHTRWHENDLAGRLQAEAEADPDADQWEVIDLPAIAEGLEDDPDTGEPGEDVLGRINGEALWPEVYNEDWLARQRKRIGAYFWAALYQQRPIPLGGGIFKRDWLRYYATTRVASETYLLLPPPPGSADNTPSQRVPLRACTKFQTSDVAASKKKGSAYTVVQTWLLTPRRQLILWDQERVQEEGPEQFDLITNGYYAERPSFIGVEAVAYQLTAIQTLRRRGLPIRELRPDGSKEARALVLAARMEGGDVFLPGPEAAAASCGPSPDFLTAFLRELFGFPKAATADQVDAASYAAKQAADLEVAGGEENKPAPVGLTGSYWK